MEISSIAIVIAAICNILTLLGTGFAAATAWVIKFNDIHHMGIKIDEMKKSFDDMKKEVCTNGERIATIEGKCTANHQEIIVVKKNKKR
jgi:hypothetical protein